MKGLSGISGALFPTQYLATAIPAGIDAQAQSPRLARRCRELQRWWAGVASAHGPATGLRALFDEVAMPLFGVLGFRASAAQFGRMHVTARLDTRARVPVALVVAPWARRPSHARRDVSATARALGAEWCFLLVPPFLSLVDARGHASRRSVDFMLPDAFNGPSFAAFWTLAHASAFDRGRTSGPAAAGGSRLDVLLETAAAFQDRVRNDLQAGVGDALRAFAPTIVPATDAFEQSLTLVYRILFLLFAESRDLVPHSHPVYRGAYTIGAFCREATDKNAAVGLWDSLAAISRLSRLGCRTGDLNVRPFNGRLFARASATSLEAGRPVLRSTRRSTTRDDSVRRALLALGTRRGSAGVEGVNYADLGVEQLGAVYEHVLDLDPRAIVTSTTRDRARPHGHSARRKQSGTFYTPQPLAEFLVRRTLAPLVSGASADQILSLRIVDPAMGSGAFLVAACRYLADALARALVVEGRCAETDLDDGEQANLRRLVAERCLAGVDANQTAVQLARLSLWLTTLARDKPLAFLDHRLRAGNSLIGASPDDLRRLAMRPTEGDLPLLQFATGSLEDAMGLAARPLLDLTRRRDDTVEDVRAKEAIWSRLAGDASPLRRWRQAADLWCARWFWSGPPPNAAETRAAFDALLRRDATLPPADLARWQAHARELSAAHGFFHWPLEFADVFYDADGQARPAAGFDAVIGNPPWEVLRGETETDHSSVSRPRLVRFVRDSGLYPSCDRGHVNLYQPFLERALSLVRPNGRVGMILPWGFAVDDGAAPLRARLLDRSTLETLVGLDNAGALFPIHRGVRFLVLVAKAGGTTREVRARFGVRTTSEIDELPARDDPEASSYPIRLLPDRLRAIGGIARRIPDVRSREDLQFLEHVADTGPALGGRDGWSVRFGRELNATEDRDGFGRDGLPVIEGKHLQPFRVDAGSGRLRMTAAEAGRRLPDRRFERARLAYRDVSAVANRLSLIAAIVPAGIVTTHTLFCLRTPLPPEQQDFLCALFNSYVLNAVVRRLMGGHLTTSLIEDLAVPVWTGSEQQRRIAALARRLNRQPTSALAHAALQAAVARLYRLDAAMFERVLAGFPLVPERDRCRALAIFAL